MIHVSKKPSRKTGRQARPAAKETLQNRVVDVACSLHRAGLVPGTSGNMSARDPESGRIHITPSGLPYHALTTRHILLIDTDGREVSRSSPKIAPSSETPMHTAIYRRHDWVGGVVHTHSPFATAYACLNRPIPAVHYLLPLVCRRMVSVVPFAFPGSHELGSMAAAALDQENKAVLLGHHGVLAIGKSIEEAAAAATTVEYVAEIYHRAQQVGTPALLADEELDKLAHYLSQYGSVAGNDAGGDKTSP